MTRVLITVLIITLMLGSLFTITASAQIPNAGYCWFSEPKAIQANGNAYLGYVTNTGAIMIAQYTHATKQTKTFQLNKFEQDDHNDPAINVLNDGRIIVFYTRHNADNIMRYRISKTPDISTLGPEKTLSSAGPTTYAQIIYKYPVIVVFYRSNLNSWNCRISTDNGATWGPEKYVFNYGSGEQMYIRTSWRWNVQGADCADIILSGHPDRGNRHGVRHCYLNIADANNIKIKAPGAIVLLDLKTQQGPIVTEKIPALYRPEENNNIKAWIWDVYATSNSHITAVYVTFPSTNDHRYNYARYNPATKKFDTKIEFAKGGGRIGEGNEPSYSGGIVFGKQPGMQDVIFASVYKPTTSRFEINKYQLVNGAFQKTPVQQSAANNYRPVSVINGKPDFATYWESGSYDYYTNIKTNIVAV